jgi:uncharacterized membrane protein HdeD (DUF308 family)
MSTVQSHGFSSESSRTSEWAAGGSIAEAVVGLAAVVLTIIGLAGVTPTYIVPIAAICVGAALAFEGSAMRNEAGMSAGFFGGLTGILLGILALVGVLPQVLTAVAVIVLACALMVGCYGVAESAGGVHDSINLASGGMHVVAGLAGLILGILALAHGTAMLSLVGLFVLSCAVAFTGTATSARLSRMFSASWWHTRRV